MRAIVTGAGGFVGHFLVPHLLECGDEVLATDHNQSEFFESSLASRYPLLHTVKFDISDSLRCSEMIAEFKPEVIYHLAGIAFVPEAENDFDRALIVNVGGTNTVIRTCHLLQHGVTVVYISSAEVYGRIQRSDLPLTEKQPVRPANNYSLSKAMGELVAQRYEQFGYVRTVVMRPFNHIGPGQNDRFVVSSFARQLARIARGKEPPVLRVGNLEVQRDFCDVRDVVRAYRLAMLRGQGVYNLCSSKPVSIRFLLDSLIKISGLKVDLEIDPTRMRSAEVPVLYGSFAKAKAELDWEPGIEITKTLAEVYQYWFSKEQS